MGFFTKKFELYQIFDADDSFYITNSNKPITYNDVIYTPAAIDRSKIELKPEMEKQSLEITIDIDHPLAQKYLLQSIESVATLRVTENYDGNFYSLWRGRLVNTSINGNSFNLKFENNTTKQLRSGAYRRYQRTCPYALYGKKCKADKSKFMTEWDVRISQNSVIKVFGIYPSIPANYFSGGMIEIRDIGLRRYITKSTASSMVSEVATKRTEVDATLHSNGVTVVVFTRVYYKMPDSDEYLVSENREDFSLPDFTGTIGITNTMENILLYEMDIALFNVFPKNKLDVGTKLILYAGCDKLNTTCSTKFNNILNFGGFPFIPQDNPFTGTII